MKFSIKVMLLSLLGVGPFVVWSMISAKSYAVTIPELMAKTVSTPCVVDRAADPECEAVAQEAAVHPLVSTRL